MELTNKQKKSLKEVIDYSFIDEEQSFTEWMSDEGWGEDEIEAFTRMSYGGKMMFMQEHKLTNHIYYHLMNLKSIA